MTPARHHAEWLSLVESSGPFLSMPVLLRVFPQGLDLRDPTRAAALREAYEDWLERGGPLLHVHTAWIRHVLENLLEWPADYIAEGQSIPAGLEATQPHFGETLRPDLVLRRPQGDAADADTTPQLLVVTYPPAQNLEKPVAGKVWKASPATRMTELLHATGVPLGLVTNGEHWMIVYAPRGETTGFASWYVDIWMQEPITLRAFHSLLCLRRFFGVAAGETLAALYAESAKDQQEVTDQLGRQVRRAVEMLVQAFDQIDEDSGRSVLAGVPEKEIYDAALTVMMRLVFLFSAEERKLVGVTDQKLYDEFYAASTVSSQLRERADQQGEEVLERRHDAWSRLLSTFRAVHGGVQHEAMRLPAYGGSLFDPDRYPFLEGREMNTRWREAPAHPLPVNNRVVLHLLEALQLLRVRVPGGGPAETRRISFRALDVEQIGHVYEGLLDHTARRATEVTLGLDGKNEPEIPLSHLEKLAGIDHAATWEILSDERKVADDGTTIVEFPAHKIRYDETLAAPAALIAFLTDATGRSAKTLESALVYGQPKARGKAKANAPSDPAASSSAINDLRSAIPDHSLFLACGQDPRLARRLQPFAGLLRADDFGRLAVIRPTSVFVTSGTDRRSSGTHYTPPSLTVPIVRHTLEPLVYIGPAEGLPEAEWKLRSPKEILALKICDMAMGSGALLVQVCRYLAERLCEAWEIAEKEHAGAMLITPDGEFSSGSAGERLLPNDPAERLAIARRYVADRCLYGVDINPMAVEMAKLSLWLITLQKDRPFTFLDHALKCGDSLLGVTSVKQIENFSLRAKPGETIQDTFATANLFRYVDEASAKRRALEDLPSNDHTQIETKNRLHAEAEAATAKVKAVADCLITIELRGLNGNAYDEQRTAEAEKVQHLMKRDADASLNSKTPTINQLSAHAREQLHGRHPFHWPLEFPETFQRGGFDGFVGNPPFLASRNFQRNLGDDYTQFLIQRYPGSGGQTDLCAYFFREAWRLKTINGTIGLLATNSISEGDTRKAALDFIIEDGGRIYAAKKSFPWPGGASLHVSSVHCCSNTLLIEAKLDGAIVPAIDATLSAVAVVAKPFILPSSLSVAFKGTGLGGDWFVITRVEAANFPSTLVRDGVLKPYVTGQEMVSIPGIDPEKFCVDFPELDASELEKRYTDLWKFVEQRATVSLGAGAAKAKWWKHRRSAGQLYRRIATLKVHGVVAKAQTGKAWAFVTLPATWLFDQSVIVFVSQRQGAFSYLQSALHEAWVDRYSSTHETRLRYSPSDVFENFPQPDSCSGLEDVGKKYEDYRLQIMQARWEGLTKTYNRFHDRGEQSADIARLRALHVEMDQAVAAAYGWSDLDLGHGFHATKQGERYTLSESARRVVLDRLLALNHQRHAEELAAGLHEKKSKTSATKATTQRGRKAKTALTSIEGLPVMPSDFRFPAPTPGLYAVNLVTALLSARPEGLRWPVLRDAFAATTRPEIMRRLALPDDQKCVAAWASRWNERATPDFLIQTLREMTGANISATGRGLDTVFALQDGPQEPATEDIGYDAWLALHVVEPLTTPILTDDEAVKFNTEMDVLLATL